MIFPAVIIFSLIISSHIETPVNYRMTVSGRSDFLAYHNFPEVYHAREISKAAFSAAAPRVTERGKNTIYRRKSS